MKMTRTRHKPPVPKKRRRVPSDEGLAHIFKYGFGPKLTKKQTKRFRRLGYSTPRKQPCPSPIPDMDEEEQEEEALARLTGILEWKRPKAVLILLQAFNRRYLKARTQRGDEYFFPVSIERNGFVRVLGILRRIDNAIPIYWNNETLKPIDNCTLVDDMGDGRGNVHRHGFMSEAVDKLWRKPKVWANTKEQER